MLKQPFLTLATVAVAACVDQPPATELAATEQAATTAIDRNRNPAGFVEGDPYTPDFDPADMDTHIDAPYYPLPVGAKWHYEHVTDEGTETIDVAVLGGTKAIGGTRGRIVRDIARLDGELLEETTDWFAQDDDDNVWYLGEATKFHNPDGTVTTKGSWQTGKRGAKPGTIMLARPKIGDQYRQEYLAGEAEDYAVVVALRKTVTVPAGTFKNCLQTRDKSTLDVTLDELKTYCPGVGLVLIEEGDSREELVSYSGL